MPFLSRHPTHGAHSLLVSQSRGIGSPNPSSVLQEEIALTEEHIEILRGTIEDNYQLFLQRVRASYMYGDIAPMSVVLGADNYYDSLVAAKTIESVAKHDNELIESLNNDKAEVEDALAQLEEDEKELDESVQQLEEEKEMLKKMRKTAVSEADNKETLV